MKKSRYLINYYRNNNPVVSRVSIKSKIFKRILIFAICSLVYYFIILFPSLNKFKGDMAVTSLILPLKYIMLISSIIAGIGIVIAILSLIWQDKFNQLYDNLSFKFKKGLFTFLDWFSILPICVAITMITFSYLFIITPVEGHSMEPTILDGEHVFVLYNKEIKRGSVVVLEVTTEENLEVYEDSFYIKRVIGLPGDTVKWTSSKQMYINGELYEEDYFDEDYLSSVRITSAFNGTFKYVEEDGTIVETTVIPDGYYFVMGDNRGSSGTHDFSHDSRRIGLIKEENIIGVATYKMNYVIPRGKIV